MSEEQPTPLQPMPPVVMMDFELMKSEDVRVLIAQDAIKIILSGRVEVVQHEYIRMVLPGHSIVGMDAHVLFEDPDPVCTACALGVALVAAVRRFNKLPALDLVSTLAFPIAVGPPRSTVADYLGKFFWKEQLAIMEAVFEGRPIDDDFKFTNAQYDAIRRYRYRAIMEGKQSIGSLFPEEEELTFLLHTIFSNIIQNKGTFIVPDLDAAYMEMDDEDPDGLEP